MVTSSAGCGSAQELCEKAVGKMQECLPKVMADKMKALPEAQKAMAEAMMKPIEAGLKTSTDLQMKACAENAAASGLSGDAVKACLEKTDCIEYFECFQKAAKTAGK